MPLPNDVTKASWEVNRTYMVPKISAFGGFTYKPRPLLNIDEIGTKYNRDHLLTKGNLPPKYETNLTLHLPLIVFTRNFEVSLSSPAHS